MIGTPLLQLRRRRARLEIQVDRHEVPALLDSDSLDLVSRVEFGIVLIVVAVVLNDQDGGVDSGLFTETDSAVRDISDVRRTCLIVWNEGSECDDVGSLNLRVVDIDDGGDWERG